MISVSEEEKARKLDEILALLQERHPEEDWALLSSFARVVFGSLPEWMGRGMAASDLSDRIWDNFRFFTKELPPPTQLYRGLPGLHVVVRHSAESEGLHTVKGKAIPMDTTIVETHTPDAPFIFDSLKNYFRKAGFRVHSAIHPILTVRRQWERVVWIGDAHEEGDKELLCRFRLEYIESKELLRRVQHEVFSVLKCVFLALEDFEEMLSTVRSLTPKLATRRSGESPKAARGFLEWLNEENFIFMGIQSYRIGPDGAPDRVPESARGVFRDPELLPVVFPGLMEEVERQLVPAHDDDRIVDIDYCSDASAIYHLEPIDDIVVRHWSPEGELDRATLLLGRFSQGSFAQRAADVPLLREKRRWLIEQSGAAPMSYAFRQIRALFNKFPRRELFYAPAAELKPFMDRMVQMTGDDEIAIHHRLGQGYAVVYVGFARIRYSYEFEKSLKRAFSERFGPVAFTASEDTGTGHILVFYFDLERLEHPIEEDEVTRLVDENITTWEDAVAWAMTQSFGEREGRRLFNRWVTPETRSGIYREATPPEEVPFDVEHLEALEARLDVAVIPRTAEHATLKVFSARPLDFIETFSTLRNLGLRVTAEMYIPIRLPDGQRANLYRYEIEDTSERIAALVENGGRLGDALRALDEERASEGDLNTLIVTAGLTWRQVEALRTYRNHLQQLRPHYNVETVNSVILQNSRVALALVRGFEVRFDPNIANREEELARSKEEIDAALDAVGSLVEDEILRGLSNLVEASLRTNFFQRPERPVVAIKVDGERVEFMPTPRTKYEIYVHSRRLEGVHLRGGKVARGGIRWSDRHDDFRTEILGLMKTQMVKNSIIVPVGSKGGFVLKGELPARPTLDAYLVDRYREFISGLLDVTDNVVDGEVVHPPDVVRYDEDDPYLVVAADKGTAHLSDTANTVAKHYGFWLGDAFASGGSVGYDHKKVGITARGAWECIKHHFENLGVDVNRDAFTAVGIGDMAGDVFGNGMLLSNSIRLVAAFNHLHIFIDPKPDPEKSYRERQRLFRIERSSWRDYDATAISPGGGVFDRAAKSVPVTPEMRALLGVDEVRVSGEELIRRILTAPVDLLYNGGIGTYVKASSEEHVDVGDRANDRVRVDGRDLRARVVGEGGNLGLTQKARLEYWTHGGILNTDAIDNSGGVDMSDHEVNIKILLDLLVKKGKVAGRQGRNQLFMEMTEDVAELVLADNAAQALALTLDGLRSAARYEDFVDLVYEMISSGIIDRADNDIPSRRGLLDMNSQERGLPRPLLALLLGHVKIHAFTEVVESSFPDGEEALGFLTAYFPERLQSEFAEDFVEHPLRREIIATTAVNELVNQAGADFLSRMKHETNAGAGDVLSAYASCCRRTGARELRAEILRAEMEPKARQEALLGLDDAIANATCAVLIGGEPVDPVAAVVGVRKALGL